MRGCRKCRKRYWDGSWMKQYNVSSFQKRSRILQELNTVWRMKCGVPYKRFEKCVGKLRHTAIGIPTGQALFGPINRIVAIRPKTVFLNRCPEVLEAFQDWRLVIQEATKELIHARELVVGETNYKRMLPLTLGKKVAVGGQSNEGYSLLRQPISQAKGGKIVGTKNPRRDFVGRGGPLPADPNSHLAPPSVQLQFGGSNLLHRK